MISRSLVLREPGTAPLLEEVEVLDPRAGEVTVRMVASGLCGTDAHALTGEQPIPRLPVVLGHEGAGIVEKVGPGVLGLAEGDHVVLALYADCGACRACSLGRFEACDSEIRRSGFAGVDAEGRSRLRLGGTDVYPMFGVGTLAEYTTVRADRAIRIPADLSLEALCLTACSVATGLGAVTFSGEVQPGDSVLVVGCGGVGLNVIQGARIAGATTIIAADVSATRLELARQVGATHVLDTSTEDLLVEHLVPGGVDVAFEVVGRPELITACLTQTRIGGTCVLVGLPRPGTEVAFDARMLAAGRRVVGCRSGGGEPRRNIAAYAELYRDGRLQLDELIGRRIDLAAAATALASPDQGVARTVVTFP